MCPSSALEMLAPQEGSTPSGKDERMYLRVSSETKSTFAYAANIEGRTMTDYVVEKSHKAAIQTISEHEKIVLSEGERLAFFDALLQPHSPSAKAREIARESEKMFGE